MKNIITILCLIVFAGCAFAEGYYIPSYTPDELGRSTTQRVENQVNNSIQNVEDTQSQIKETSSKTEVQIKRKRRSGNSNNPNSYYNFGTINGFKGKF